MLLKDIKDFPAVNAVYAEFFREDPPARATFQATFQHFFQTSLIHSKNQKERNFSFLLYQMVLKVGALPRDASVEVEAVAVVGKVGTSAIIVIVCV